MSHYLWPLQTVPCLSPLLTLPSHALWRHPAQLLAPTVHYLVVILTHKHGLCGTTSHTEKDW